MEKKIYPSILETERLILRPLNLADKNAIYKWTGDSRVAKFMLYTMYKSPDEADVWLDSLYKDENQIDYGFVWKKTNELIGSGGLVFDSIKNVWNIGYNLRYDMWNKGIVTEACKKIIEYAKQKYGAKTIEGKFAIDNIGSKRVMEKLGMTFVEETEYTKWDGSESFKANLYRMTLD